MQVHFSRLAQVPNNLTLLAGSSEIKSKLTLLTPKFLVNNIFNDKSGMTVAMIPFEQDTSEDAVIKLSLDYFYLGKD